MSLSSRAVVFFCLGLMLPLTSCTGGSGGAEKSTLRLTLPSFANSSANSSAKIASDKAGVNGKSVSTFGDRKISRLMINVTAPDLPTPIVWIWQANNSQNSIRPAPTEVALDVPKGVGRVVQVLAVLDEDNSVYTTPYNCSSGGDGSSRTLFFYGDATTPVAGKEQAVSITVASVAIAQGLEGKVTGRFLPIAGVNKGPSGKFTTRVALPGKPAMIVEEKEVFDGWFTGYAIEGVPFRYDIDGQNILGQDLDLAGAAGYLSAAAANAVLMQSASGWQAQSQNGAYCGGVQKNAKKFLFGAFGPGASAMKICAPTVTNLNLFSGYTYAASAFNFSGRSSWNPTSVVDGDARILYPTTPIGTIGIDACATGTAFVDRLNFQASSLDSGSGGDELLGVSGPFLSPGTGGLTATLTGPAVAPVLALSWNYVANMDGLLTASDIFVRTGVYANGTANEGGDADFRDGDNGYKCASLSTLGFTIAGTAGKDAAGHLISSYSVAGVNNDQLTSRKVQVVVCPRIGDRILASGLACGERQACGSAGAGVTPAISLATSSFQTSAPTLSAGSVATLTVVTRDVSGQPIYVPGRNIQFLFTGAGGGSFTAPVEHSDGSYTAAFTGTTAGALQITAKIDGANLSSAPLSLSVLPGPVSAANSTLFLTGNSVLPYSSVNATVSAKDAFNNLVNVPATAVSLMSVNACTSTFSYGAVSGSNGSYQLQVLGLIPGTECLLGATINGVQISTVLPALQTDAISGRFAYATNEATNVITTLSISNELMRLTPTASFSAGGGGGLKDILVHRNGRFAYALNRTTASVQAYLVIPSTGALSPIGSSNLMATPSAMALDPVGRFLYVGSLTGISVFQIDASTGALTSYTSLAVGSVGGLAIDSSGRFLYATLKDSSLLNAFLINATTGGLTPSGSSASTLSGPTVVRVHPSGRFAYVANSVSAISVYTLDRSSGAPTSQGAVSAQSLPSAIEFDVTGRFVYVANRPSGTISTFAVNFATGGLSGLGVISSNAGGANATALPSALSLDPSGRILLVANNGSGTIARFLVGPADGQLIFANELSLGLGAGTISLATTAGPTRYAYSASSNQLSSWSINPNTDAWSNIGYTSASGGIRELAFDPARRYVYAAASTTGSVDRFRINRQTGMADYLDSISAGAGARAIAIDPTGRFAYVANGAGNSVTKLSVAPATGQLTGAGLVPVGNVGDLVYSVVIEPTGRFAYALISTGTIFMFSIDPNAGGLIPLSTASLAVGGAGAQTLRVSPNGRFVYVTSTTAGAVYSFEIEPSTGQLYATSSNPITAATGAPYSLATDSAGLFAYTVGSSGTVSLFAINGAEGFVSPLSPASLTTTTSTQSVTVDETGRYVMLANDAFNRTSVYRASPSTGAITFLSNYTNPGPGTSTSCTATVR